MAEMLDIVGYVRERQAATSQRDGGSSRGRMSLSDKPAARIGGGPNPEVWFPWVGRGRPNLYYDDTVRCKLRNGVTSNKMRATDCDDEYYNAPTEWGVVAIGVKLEHPEACHRMEALSGYRVVPAEARAALQAAAQYCRDTWPDFPDWAEQRLSWVASWNEAEPLHLVTQTGQPYGSVRRCCERCGRMCWRGQEGSAQRWTDSAAEWAAAGDHC